jgi:hypothetical protein
MVEIRILMGKDVSDLKARLDYCEDLPRICEQLDFCFPAQLYTEVA